MLGEVQFLPDGNAMRYEGESLPQCLPCGGRGSERLQSTGREEETRGQREKVGAEFESWASVVSKALLPVRPSLPLIMKDILNPSLHPSPLPLFPLSSVL